jgi:hypothetical protein
MRQNVPDTIEQLPSDPDEWVSPNTPLFYCLLLFAIFCNTLKIPRHNLLFYAILTIKYHIEQIS